LQSRAPQPYARNHLFVIAAYGLMMILLWLPFGLNAVTGGEEWAMISLADTTDFRIGGARPLLRLATEVGYLIYPDSLAGFFLVMCICILGKSISIYGIIHQLTPKLRSVAFASGALLMVAPLEYRLYDLTLLNYHFTAFTFAASVFFFIWHYNHPHWLKLLMMWLLLLPTSLITEGVFPLLMVVPFLILWKEGHITRRFLKLSALWYVIPLAAIVYIASITLRSVSGASYQRSLIAADNSIATLVDVSWTLFRSHLWDRWLPSSNIQNTSIEPQFVLISSILTVLTFIMVRYLTREQQAESSQNQWWLFGIGSIGAFAGFAIFLITDLRLTYERTTFFSALGAMITGSLVIYVLSRSARWSRIVFTVLVLAYSCLFNCLRWHPTAH
jgi:hypothetical protein